VNISEETRAHHQLVPEHARQESRSEDRVKSGGCG
jgi:hypothetical protein